MACSNKRKRCCSNSKFFQSLLLLLLGLKVFCIYLSTVQYNNLDRLLTHCLAPEATVREADEQWTWDEVKK